MFEDCVAAATVGDAAEEILDACPREPDLLTILMDKEQIDAGEESPCVRGRSLILASRDFVRILW